MLICEMAAFYKAQGRTLYEVMQDLYSEFGYYLNTVVSVTREGADGMKEIAGMMASLRENPPAEIAGQAIVRMGDYQASRAKDLKTGAEEVIDLPQSDEMCIRDRHSPASNFSLRNAVNSASHAIS